MNPPNIKATTKETIPMTKDDALERELWMFNMRMNKMRVFFWLREKVGALLNNRLRIELVNDPEQIEYLIVNMDFLNYAITAKSMAPRNELQEIELVELYEKKQIKQFWALKPK